MREVVMLSERIAPFAVGSGVLFILAALVAGLFVTNFPATAPIKALAGYRVIAGAYVAVGAMLLLFFAACFAIVTMNLP